MMSFNTLHTIGERLPPVPRIPWPSRWACHRCHYRYRIGVTNRCLDCGHRRCSPDPKNPKKKKPGKVCVSGFDYYGWEEYNKWRNEVRKMKGQLLQKKNRRPGDHSALSATKRVRMSNGSPAPVTPAEKLMEWSCWDDCLYPTMCEAVRCAFSDDDVTLSNTDVDDDNDFYTASEGVSEGVEAVEELARRLSPSSPDPLPASLPASPPSSPPSSPPPSPPLWTSSSINFNDKPPDDLEDLENFNNGLDHLIAELEPPL